MELDGEAVLAWIVHALVAAVIGVDEGFGADALQGGGDDGVAVVLAGDMGAAGFQAPDWLVAAAVTVAELYCIPAQGEGRELMAQADAENGDAAAAAAEAENLPDLRDGEGVIFRVAGAVGEHDAVRVHGEDGFRGGGGGKGGDGAAAALQAPEDIPLGAVIQEGNAVFLPAEGGVEFNLGIRDGCDGVRDAKIPDGGEVIRNPVADHGVHDAFLPGDADDLPGIHALEARDAGFHKIIFQGAGGAEVGGRGAQVPHNIAEEGALSLKILLNDTVVADEGKGLGDDLAVVAGICQGFQVSFHPGGEDEFADAVQMRADALAFEDGSVGKDKIGHGWASCRWDNRYWRDAGKAPGTARGRSGGAGSAKHGSGAAEKILRDVECGQETHLILRGEAEDPLVHAGADDFRGGLFGLHAEHEAEAGDGEDAGGAFQQRTQEGTFFPDILQEGIRQAVQDGKGRRAGHGIAAEGGAMVAEGEDILHLLPQEAGAQGQAAGEAFGGGNHIRMEAVMHIGVEAAGAAVAGLDLIHHEEDIAFLQEGFQIPGKGRGERDDAALALDALDEYGGDGAVPAQRRQGGEIAGGEMGEARGEGLEELMVVGLSGGCQSREGTAMEAVFQGHDGAATGAFGFRCPFAGYLDGAFVGLGAGIAKEDPGKAGAQAQLLRQAGAGGGVIQIGHMLHGAELLLRGGDPVIVRYAEGGDGDAGAHVDVFLSVGGADQGAFAGDDFQGEAFVGMGDVFFVKLKCVHLHDLRWGCEPARGGRGGGEARRGGGLFPAVPAVVKADGGAGEAGAGAFIRQELHEDGVGNAAVHDDYILHAPGDGGGAAFRLRDHAAGDDAALPQGGELVQGDLRNEGGGIAAVPEDPGDVRHEDHGFRPQGAGDEGCSRIPVDIVGIAGQIAADGGDHGDITFLQQVCDGADMHLSDLPDESQALVLRGALEQAAVHAGEAHGFAALHLQEIHEGLVDLAGEDHLDDVHGFPVRDPQAADKFRFLAEAVHEVVDFGPAAMDQDHADADEPEQDKVLHDLLFEMLIHHGVAAVFDHNGFTGVFPDIGQGGSQDFCALQVCQFAVHGHLRAVFGGRGLDQER